MTSSFRGWSKYSCSGSRRSVLPLFLTVLAILESCDRPARCHTLPAVRQSCGLLQCSDWHSTAVQGSGDASESLLPGSWGRNVRGHVVSTDSFPFFQSRDLFSAPPVADGSFLCNRAVLAQLFSFLAGMLASDLYRNHSPLGDLDLYSDPASSQGESSSEKSIQSHWAMLHAFTQVSSYVSSRLSSALGLFHGVSRSSSVSIVAAGSKSGAESRCCLRYHLCQLVLPVRCRVSEVPNNKTNSFF